MSQVSQPGNLPLTYAVIYDPDSLPYDPASETGQLREVLEGQGFTITAAPKYAERPTVFVQFNGAEDKTLDTALAAVKKLSGIEAVVESSTFSID